MAAAIAGMRFPVVLKPRIDPAGFKRAFGRQVLEADDGETLLAQWDRAAAHRPQVSEVIPGVDDALWTLGSYRDADGTPRASFTGRKLRQWPPRFGTARAAEACWDPGLAARGHALLDEMGFHGISQVEVKRDPRDGRDYLIEVNPRSWLWISLATGVGVNLPLAAYLDATGTPRTRPGGHRTDVRSVALSGDADAHVLLLRTFVSDGLADPDPPRWSVLLWATHPAPARRIRAVISASDEPSAPLLNSPASHATR